MFPKFQEGDPTAWLSKAKQYFTYQEMPLDRRVSFASYHLEDEANEWWQATSKALHEEHVPVTWDVFEEELWARFGPTAAEDFDEALSKIRQTGTLREFQREFERLQNKVSGWTQKALIGTYIGGLNDNISDGIRMFQPKTLKATIELARMRDEQVQRTRKSFSNRNNHAPPSPSQALTAKVTPTGQPKRLSWEELRRKRSLGLCFSCDEKYTPDHRCQKSQLLLIEGVEEDDEEDAPDLETTEAEITVQALTGWDSPKTIRTRARIQKHEMVALIDSGATHSFIHEKVAKHFGLTMTPTPLFRVRVADGRPLRCTGVYKQVTTIVGGVSFCIDLFPLPLTGLDMVLGMTWLTLLGPTLCDWEAQTLEFTWAGEKQRVCGLRNKTIAEAQPEIIIKEIQLGHACFTLRLQQPNDEMTTVSEEMQLLLNRYADLCYLYKMLINLLQLIENYIHGVYHGEIEHQQNKRSAISCVFLTYRN